MLKRSIPVLAGIGAAALIGLSVYVGVQIGRQNAEISSDAAGRQASPKKITSESAADSENASEMPYADLLEIASKKEGLVFREDWGVWERRIKTYIDDYFESKQSTYWDRNIGSRKSLADHFMRKYRNLWEQGGSINNAPLPIDISDSGKRTEIVGLYDEELGIFRRPDPTIYVDLSKSIISHGVAAGYTSDTFIYKDILRPLSDIEQQDIMLTGMPPVGVKVIYIDQNGDEYPPGIRPDTLDPLGGFGQIPDKQLKFLVETSYDLWSNPTPDQEKMLQGMLQTPFGRRTLEISYNYMMQAWAQRPHLWGSASSAAPAKTPPPNLLPPVETQNIETAPSEENPSSRLPLPPPLPSEDDPDATDCAPDLPAPEQDTTPSARDLEAVLDALKRESVGEGLTEEERSLLRLKGLYDLYEAEQKRLRRGFESPRSSESSP